MLIQTPCSLHLFPLPIQPARAASLFFVRPSVQDMRLVAGQIFSAQQVFGPALRYNVFFAPHKTLVCEQVLEDEGVLEFVDLGEYQLNLIPLEADGTRGQGDMLIRHTPYT